jgi:hypothetical protein
LGRDSASESIFSEAATALNFCFFFFKKKEEERSITVDFQHLVMAIAYNVLFP